MRRHANRQTKRPKKPDSFTIIEVMIVLAVASFILIVIFLAVPSLMRSKRNAERKNTVRLVYAAIQEYESNNLDIPSCNSAGGISCAATPAKVRDLFTNYMPGVIDPLSGSPYNSEPLVSGSGELHTSSNSVVFVYDSHYVNHSKKPNKDQLLIEIGHWCYANKPDDGPATNPIASDSTTLLDNEIRKFVILMGTEGSPYFCIDNL